MLCGFCCPLCFLFGPSVVDEVLGCADVAFFDPCLFVGFGVCFYVSYDACASIADGVVVVSVYVWCCLEPFDYGFDWVFAYWAGVCFVMVHGYVGG